MNRFVAVAPFLAHFLLAVPGVAQSWTLGAGAGGIDHEGGLGTGYHLNLRRELIAWRGVEIDSRSGEDWKIPAASLEVDLFAQHGRSGTRVVQCVAQEGFCASGGDPLYLLGAGILSRVDLTSADRPVQLYFIPASAALYIRGGHFFESKLGGGETFRRGEVRLAGGFGNGVGVQLRIGRMVALIELRAILVHDLDGVRGGAIPVSVGMRL